MIEPKPANAQYNDEQWQAIQQTGSNILVAASAGSGKTTVLIERILTHIRKHYASINELLVVTFTEAAANEMKERMEIKLKEALYDSDSSVDQPLILEQLNQLPMAHIRTLHSFCLQVIQQFFYLIDFNPSFSLMTDETQKQLMYQEVWESLLENIIEKQVDEINSEILQDLLSRYSNPRDDQGLFDLVLDLHHFSSSHPEPEIWLSNLSHHSQNFQEFTKSALYKQHLAPSLDSALQSAYQLYLQADHYLAGASAEVHDKYAEFLNQEREQIGIVLELFYASRLDEMSQQLSQLTFDRWPSKPRKTEEGELIEQLKQMRDQAKKMIVDQVSSLFSLNYEQLAAIEADVAPIIAQLGKLTIAYKRALNARKRQLNIIDYSDLEHLTLNILAPYNNQTLRREPSLAAKHYQHLFREVLVDEYQDINEIQATILSWLSHENDPDQTGNLFMVGDVKQSIYGFRMAEPTLFMTKYRKYQKHEDGELIVLDKNYRSRDEILQFTNFVFERIMDTQFGEMDYGLQESLKTGNLSFEPASPNDCFDIQLLLHEKEFEDDDNESDNGFDSSVEVQAHLIAQDVFNRISSKEMIYDKTLKSMRPVEFRDFVILTATRNPFLSVQQAFQAYDLPINAQNVETYFQRHEVQLMIALLKLIDNPRQDLPLVAILRSFFVGLNDEELSQIRIQHKHGSYYDAYLHYLQNFDDEIAKKLRVFNEQLINWQVAAGERRLVELIWMIYQETYFLDYAAGLSNGEQRQANLHAFYEQAAKFEQTNFKGVFGFIRYIEELTQHQNDLAEPIVLGEDQNFVRIMTVHASKGLEFPIVYLMNLNKAINLQDVRTKRYVLSKNFGLGSDLYDYTQLLRYPSFVKEAIKIEKSMSLKAEELRKLYVALTRCEQKLILVGTIKNEEDWLKKMESTRKLTDMSDKLANLQERQQARSWLDWIRMAIAVSETTADKVTNFDVSQISTRFISTETIDEQRKYLGQTNTLQSTDEWLSHTLEKIENTPIIQTPLLSLMEELSNTDYRYQLASNTSSYQSVSELKRMYEEPSHDQLGHFEDRSLLNQKTIPDKDSIQSIRYTQDTFEPPKFMQEKEMTYAEIGILTHFVMQQLNFAEFNGMNDTLSVLREQIAKMVENRLITEEQLRLIKIESIEFFLKSEIGQALISEANELYREQAFSYLLPAKWLFKAQVSSEHIQQLQNDQLLIHGIIDTYYDTVEGLVILDYKTDRFRPFGNTTRQEQIEIIANKYKFQLSLYAQALAQAKNRPIHKVAIVLLDFNEICVYEDLYRFD